MAYKKTVEDYRREIARRAAEARERASTPKPAEVGVRFVKTRPRLWNGNGFGDSPAHWVALMGDVEVGRYEGAYGDIFGEREFWCDTGVARWKRRICREAVSGL